MTAVLALAILLGGIRRIAEISTVLVPVMALLYLGGRTGGDPGKPPPPAEALILMLRCAVAPEAALGGALGIVTAGRPSAGALPGAFFPTRRG